MPPPRHPYEGAAEEDMVFHAIVARLQQPPFHHTLNPSDLQTTPLVLLQLLSDVLAYLEPDMAMNVKSESEDTRVARTLHFLGRVLKCPLLRVDDDDDSAAAGVAAAGLRQGDTAVVATILLWCLENVPQLQRRAYLGRYLMPADVPVEHLQQDLTLADLHARLGELQAEFKAAHQALEQAEADLTVPPGEMRAEVVQLEEEKHQLEDKIAKMARAAQRETGFDEMLQLISALRHQQEEEVALYEKQREQRQAIEDVERRLRALSTTEVQSSSVGKRRIMDGPSAEAALEDLQQEVRQLQHQVLPPEMLHESAGERSRRQGKAASIRREDVEAVALDVKQAEREVQALQEQVETALNAAPKDDRFAIYRQHALVAAGNLGEKEEELVRLQQVLSSLSSFPDGEEDVAKRQEELEALREHTRALHGTQDSLQGRVKDWKGFLQHQEQRQQPRGSTSDETSTADLYVNIQGIAHQIKQEKQRMQPQLKALKKAKAHIQSLQQDHALRKAAYERVTLGWEGERRQRMADFLALKELLEAKLRICEQQRREERGV